MSDEEFEKFEITDYDLDNEFNVHRSRKKLSKNQQIYGNFCYLTTLSTKLTLFFSNK